MDKARLGSVMVFFVAATSAMACGAGRNGKDASTATPSNPGARKAAATCTAPATPIEAIGKTGTSSTLALGKIAGKRVALVADEDAKAILTVDLDTRAPLAETALEGTPGQILIGPGGRVFVTLRDKNEIAVLGANKAATAPLTTLCGAPTPSEPVALASSPDDTQILVAAGWGQRLVAFDAGTLAPKYETRVPREPRSIVVSDDGKTAFVAHAVGSVISAVDLVNPKHETRLVAVRGFFPQQQDQIKALKKQVAILQKKDPQQATKLENAINKEARRFEEGRVSCQGFTLAKSSAVSGRIFAPAVMVEPGEPQSRPDGYGDVHQPTETPAVAVLDEATAEPLDSTIMVQADRFFARLRGNDSRDTKPECLLPRASVVDPASKSLLVTCFGIDAVVAYDATAAMPLAAERRRWTVGSGPTGVVIDTEKNRGVVWSQFDRSLATFTIGTNALVDDKVSPVAVDKTMMPALKTKLPAEYALGRILFHAAGDGRISHDGRACASCHPDGRDDAITWATPEGPRRSIMLAGRTAKTAPYAWNGNASSLHNHLGNTFDRLSGKGLRSIELDALVAYISGMPAPTPEPLTAADKAKAERGKQIFASRETGCAGCHTGTDYTDNRNHDVGSRDKADRGTAFNTPSLHFVGGTGPYFHDGRYANLADLLVQSDGKMGHTKHLSPADIEALETFLKTL